MKKFLKIFGLVALLVVVLGGIYIYIRVNQINQQSNIGQEKEKIGGGGVVPAVNPLETNLNPFKDYNNPFNSQSFGLGFKSVALVGASVGAVTFPIEELGGCRDQNECRFFCDEIENISSCISFAEKHKLLSRQDLENDRKFAQTKKRGPGGCVSKSSCDGYCGKIENIKECVNFAKDNGLLSGRELEEAEAVSRFVSSGGAMPGNCGSKKACEEYCQQASHIKECVEFGEKTGLIPPKELAEVKKVMPFILSGETPGGCVRKEDCDRYCSVLENMSECLAFAEKAGLIPPEELEMAKRILPLMQKGETPGGCVSKEQCEDYCSSSDHFGECLDFAEKTGIMKKAEIFLLRQAVKLLPKTKSIDRLR